MSIVPLPVFEADADPSRRDALTDEETYARLRPPATIVVRFGAMRMIGEFPYQGDAKPGCGSKLVIRTPRGTEMAEMLTTTCSNSGCGKSVSRAEMLTYIDNSGGRDYPFHEHGRVLRVATIDDLNRWSQAQAEKPELLRQVRRIVDGSLAPDAPPMKVVDVEPIFGGEMLTVFYLSEERIEFRDLVRALAHEFGTRIEMRHVGARDEARLVADYERCGQHCCCQTFLKVLKPVSMKSAKVQKATLDPLKISGRCGRLMCCLRYEDQTYEELKKRLPRNKSRVGTSEGPGWVVDSKILVQLVLVRLDHDGREIAVPVEELVDPENCPIPAPVVESAAIRAAPRAASPSTAVPAAPSDPLRGLSPDDVARRAGRRDDSRRRNRGERHGPPGGGAAPAGPGPGPGARPPRPADPAAPSSVDPQDVFRARAEAQDGADDRAPQREDSAAAGAPGAAPSDPPAPGTPGRRRRRRGRGGRGDAPSGGASSP